MCTIQNYTFVINGSIPASASCNATVGTRIELETDVTFSQNEIGTDVKVGVVVIYPDFTQHVFYSPVYRVVNTTTQVFIVDLTNLLTTTGAGLYATNGAAVYSYPAGQQLCSAMLQSYGCSSLTLQAGPSASCTIQQGYFTKNGAPISGASCSVSPTDAIALECIATFNSAAVGKQYKAELKVTVPTGAEFSFFTSLITVSATQKFTANFTTPIYAGLYTAVWFVIYDAMGATLCSSNGANTSYCRTMTVSAQQFHNECTNNVCTQVTGTGTNQCTPVGAPCGVTQYHNECIGGVCTQVTGAGTNQCTPVGSPCGVTQYHNECIGGVCTQVTGAGTNACATIGASCAPPPPSQFQCSPACTANQYCVLGVCIDKTYATYGAVGIAAIVIMSVLK